MAIQVQWYFAFITEGEVFNAVTHARVDTELLGFTFEHAEAQFATLRIITRNPLGTGGTFALGLLGRPDKQHCLFSVSFNGGAAQLLFRGRIVAVPTDVFGPKVTIDFQARPSNYTAQKTALADAIKAGGPPVWCPEFYDEQQREDAEIVLESISSVWYIDPTTHEVKLSDILIGDGDALSFGLTEHRFDGMRMSLAGVPTPAVDVDAELSWTQRATGNIAFGLSSSSYTLTADAYPKAGAGFGDGWTVQTANVIQSHTFETRSVQSGLNLTIKWWDKTTTTINVTQSDDVVSGPGIRLGQMLTDFNSASDYDEESGKLTGYSLSYSYTDALVPLYDVSAVYTVNYDAARPLTERVTYTLRADVQATVTSSGDAERPRLEFKSQDLSELIDGTAPIGDPRRRSYATQARGNDAIFYTLLCAMAKLKRDARAVQIDLAPLDLNILPELRLDKNAFVYDWRLPSGSASGKIIRFTCTKTPPVDGGSASFSLNVSLGCAVGRGGELTEEGGEPDYVEDDYVEEDDAYQERTGEIIVFNDEVGFTPPVFAPNDDGIDFLSITGAIPFAVSMFEIPPTFNIDAGDQAAIVIDSGFVGGSAAIPIGAAAGLPPPSGYNTWGEAMQAAVQARNEAVRAMLDETAMNMVFKLKDLRGKFETPIALEVQDPKIPRMIDLEFEEES